MRRTVVRLITFAGGLFFLLEFLLPAEAPAWLGGFDNPLTPYLPMATRLAVVVGTMAFLLGPFNLVRSHLMTILRKRKGYLESSVFLVFLAGTIAAKGFGGTDLGRSIRLNVLHDALVYGVATAFFASSMALLAFYLVSAAHRAFRMSNLDAGLMMAAAVVVLLGQVPLGDWLTGGLPAGWHLRDAAQWVLQVPNTAVQRAVLIGACGGAIAAGMRHWLGLGRGGQQG